ncbi:MAG: DUF4280 domain-containing protein [Firmicutes bacterium HGW-Firmicutes-15]|nr:MAG: DUF4280 domain-containing protein [Firmicutes bacterium HGW-Firmicutes-15]
MGFLVCNGALLQCSFGVAPTPLTVLPKNKVMATMPAATIMDNVAFMNIIPFGMCSSMANPAVASATAAAWGVLTPMPCTPMTSAPWAPGCPTVLIANNPALNDSSKLICSYGGVIQILFGGQVQTQVP